jgi:hypothetical protein
MAAIEVAAIFFEKRLDRAILTVIEWPCQMEKGKPATEPR